MQVGTTKDQGLYTKPSAAVHPAAGTLPQYNTIQYLFERRQVRFTENRMESRGHIAEGGDIELFCFLLHIFSTLCFVRETFTSPSTASLNEVHNLKEIIRYLKAFLRKN